MDAHSFYLDQYKALREEIMFTMGQVYSTEMYAAIAVIGIYAWLAVNGSRISIRVTWFFPPFLLIACAIHCLILCFRLSTIGAYLREIEKVLAADSKIVGWENYKLSHSWVDTSDYVLATVAWMSALIGSIALSWRAASTRPADVVQSGSP